MGVQAYTIAVVFMAGLGGLAALGAVALAIHLFGRRRPARRPVFVFEPPEVSPILLREPEPPAPAAIQAPPPEPEPEPEPVIAPAPVAAPALAPRLEIALMAPRAPGRLKVPVDLARGRILELSLPLWISAAGGGDLDEVRIHIRMPNEITYAASLDRMTRQPPADPPGARTSYLSAEHQTTIEISIPHLKGGGEAIIAIPVSIKHAAVGIYPITASASAPEIETIERLYELELIDASTPPPDEDPVPGWICWPDEAARIRDPHLPLDRIVSTKFGITEPRDDWAEPAPLPL